MSEVHIEEVLVRRLTPTIMESLAAGYGGDDGGGSRYITVPQSHRDEVSEFFGFPLPDEDAEESPRYALDLEPVEGIPGSEGPIVLRPRITESRWGEWLAVDQHNNRYVLWSADYGFKEWDTFEGEDDYDDRGRQVVLFLRDTEGNFHARLVPAPHDPAVDNLPSDLQEAVQQHDVKFVSFDEGNQPVLADLDRVFIDKLGKSQTHGQGPEDSPAMRRAVEALAMARARERYEGEGWTVEDVSGTEPYDLACTRGDETLDVEVKGTRSPGSPVILTANEVEHAIAEHPATALFVLHDIEAISKNPPRLRNGETHIVQPWRPEEEDLAPKQFNYDVPGRETED